MNRTLHDLLKKIYANRELRVPFNVGSGWGVGDEDIERHYQAAKMIEALEELGFNPTILIKEVIRAHLLNLFWGDFKYEISKFVREVIKNHDFGSNSIEITELKFDHIRKKFENERKSH